MLYDSYQRKIDRIADILARILRQMPKILAALGAVMVVTITLLATKGIVGKTTCTPQTEYGEAVVCDASAFLSDVWFEYAQAGSADWTQEVPKYPGDYQMRAGAHAAFGKIRYGKNVPFTILPKPVEVSVAVSHVLYGELPKTKATLVGTDTFTCDAVIYQDALSENTTVQPDIKAIKAYDRDGQDITYAYTWIPVSTDIIFDKREITLTVADASCIYNGQKFSYEQYELSAGTLNEGDQIQAVFPNSLTEVDSVVNQPQWRILNELSQDVTIHYLISEKIGTITVEKRPLIIKVDNLETVYSGDAFDCQTFVIDDSTTLADGQTIEVASASAYINCGTHTNRLVFRILDGQGVDRTVNYNLLVQDGSIHIKQRPINIATESQSWMYDGKDHSHELLTADNLVSNHQIKPQNCPKIKNVGKADNKFSILIFADEQDVTSNYAITYQYGTLEITKRPITVQSAKNSWMYDGISHREASCQVISEISLVPGHNLVVMSSASLTDVGETENIFEISIHAGTENVTLNYEITYINGKLTVTKRPVNILTGSGKWIYDDQPHKESSFEITSKEKFVKDHAFQIEEYASITDVGNKKNIWQCKGVFDNTGKDVSHNYRLSWEWGNLTIDPRPITLRVTDTEKIYDGQPLNGGVTEVSPSSKYPLVEGHSLSAVISGSRTDVGQSESRIGAVTIKSGERIVTRNYAITKENGLITVLPRPIILETLSATKYYDGTPLVYHEFIVSKESPYPLVEGEIAQLLILGSQTEIGESENHCDPSQTKILKGHKSVTHNYDITYKTGTLTVKPYAILKITTDSDSKAYDGTPLTNSNYTVEIVEGNYRKGDRLIVDVTGIQIKVGTSENVATAKVLDRYGSDASIYYEIYVLPGILEVYDDASSTDGEHDGIAFKIRSDKTGVVYMRERSYGDYSGMSTHWGGAIPYTKQLPGGYNYNYLSTVALMNSGAFPHIAEIKELTACYMLPYYLGFEGEYKKSSNDVYLEHYLTEYNAMFYSLSDSQKSYRDYQGNLGELEPFELKYREFVYKNYMKVDKETRKYFESVIKQQNFDINTPDVIDKIASFIQNSATYNLKYDVALDRESNPVIAFLETYKEGVCRHYATAATLLYRTLGIPARYTVGFMAETVANEFVDVSYEKAHAWVEVYIDGVGWIQVEVTGSMEGGSGGGGSGGGGGGGGSGSGGGGGGGLITEEPPIIEVSPRYVCAVYDGKYHAAMPYLDVNPLLSKLLDAGYRYECVVSGSRKTVGKGKSTVEKFALYDPNGKNVTEKFNIVLQEGVIEIVPSGKQIARIYLYQLMKVYDSTKLSYNKNDFEILELPDGLKLSVSINISLQNADYLTLTKINDNLSQYITYRVYKGNRDVTEQYHLVCDYLDSEINQQSSYVPIYVEPRYLVIGTPSATKIEDGTPLTAQSFYMIEGALVGNDVIIAQVIGEVSEVGAKFNEIDQFSFKIENDSGEDMTKNYSVYANFGILTILPDE